MIEIKKYDHAYHEKWDHFILNARNAHFMFCRSYMDYHSDRFNDFSLIFFEENQIVAVLPANINDNILYSHQGLTFGGLLFNNEMTTPLMIAIINRLIEYLKRLKIKKLIYKHIPYIYNLVPAQEDLYALFSKGANLYRVDVSSTIDLHAKPAFSSRRKRGIKKALSADLTVKKSHNYEEFHKELSTVLEMKYNTTPTHSLNEIKHLANKFPENISLYTTIDQNNSLLAAVLIFEMNHWVHAQYIVASEQGKAYGALDLLFDELINKIFIHKRFFDFGISTEEQGKVLNQGLITQKEEFGARAVVHNFLELNIN
jgi:hypothetical protein